MLTSMQGLTTSESPLQACQWRHQLKRHEETEKQSRESCILPPVTSTDHKHKADADLTQKQLQLKGFGPNFSNMNL
jgi:hypothetical protein